MSEQEPYTLTTKQAKDIARWWLKECGLSDSEDKDRLKAYLADLWDVDSEDITHEDCQPILSFVQVATVSISIPRRYTLKHDPYNTRNPGGGNNA